MCRFWNGYTAVNRDQRFPFYIDIADEPLVFFYIVKEVPGAREWEDEMARRRNNLDWKGQVELSLDPEKATRFHKEGFGNKEPICSMCGSYCAIQDFNRSQHNLEKEL